MKKCKHQWRTVSNYYGDYIDYVSGFKYIFRSKQKCDICGKERYSEYLDKNCKVTNDGMT